MSDEDSFLDTSLYTSDGDAKERLHVHQGSEKVHISKHVSLMRRYKKCAISSSCLVSSLLSHERIEELWQWEKKLYRFVSHLIGDNHLETQFPIPHFLKQRNVDCKGFVIDSTDYRLEEDCFLKNVVAINGKSKTKAMIKEEIQRTREYASQYWGSKDAKMLLHCTCDIDQTKTSLPHPNNNLPPIPQSISFQNPSRESLSSSSSSFEDHLMKSRLPLFFGTEIRYPNCFRGVVIGYNVGIYVQLMYMGKNRKLEMERMIEPMEDSAKIFVLQDYGCIYPDGKQCDNLHSCFVESLDYVSRILENCIANNSVDSFSVKAIVQEALLSCQCYKEVLDCIGFFTPNLGDHA